MTERDLFTIQEIKKRAILQQRYDLAATLRAAEREIRKCMNDNYTEEILKQITEN